MPILSTLSVACARAFGFGSGDLFAGAALALDFDKTTTLDSRITFTRATSATYFDSSGVLQTASSGAARFDHRLENSVWVNKGLLIEEQRTNTQLRSEEFDNASWIKVASTVTANATTAPDGTSTADALFVDTSTAVHFVAQLGSWTSGTTYTASFFVKANGYSNVQVRRYSGTNFGGPGAYYIDLDDGSVVGTPNWTIAVENVGNGWWRVSATATATATNANEGFGIGIVDDSGNTSFTGDDTKGIYVWGAQVETGAFPTSYIATTTASVTRNADQASMTSTNFSDWYNATEGTVFWQGQFLSANGGGSIRRAYTVSDNTANEFLVLSAANASDVGSIASARDGGVNQAVLNSPDPLASVVANQTYKHGFAYKADDFAATLDGISPTTDTSGTLPTVDRLYLGTRNDGTAEFLNGHLSKFYYWNTRKSNSFLQNITS